MRNVGSTVTIDPYSPLAGRKAELLRWLTEEGRFAPDTGRLLELLCDKLAALGIPIARATVHVRTLHPEYRGAARIWRRGESIEIRTTRHGIQFTSDYQNSPIQHVIGGSTPGLAKPPTGAFRSSQHCGRKASRIT